MLTNIERGIHVEPITCNSSDIEDDLSEHAVDDVASDGELSYSS